MKTYFVVAFGAALVAMGVTAIAIRLARAMGLLDAPNVRKVHALVTPRIGGVAIVAGMLATTVPVLLLDNVIGQALRSVQTQVVALLAGGVLIFLVGLADDVGGLRARTKLLAQLAVGTGVYALGLRIERIALPGGFVFEFGSLAWPVTMAWIVGITNAVNLIDGLDGLAAGIAAITCAAIGTLAVFDGQPVLAVLMLALLGSLCGFLFFNFNPARIFMGDCGSLFLGFMLAGASVLCAAKTAICTGLLVPLLVLGVPIFDMFFSMLRRFLDRRSMFAPDRGHIHHRLLDMGLNHRRAVIVLYLVTLVMAALGLGMMALRDLGMIAVFALALAVLVLVFRFTGAVRLREAVARARRNLAIARQAGEERRCFEEAQLHVRQATTFEAWWRAVHEAAERLGFLLLSMTVTRRDGTSQTLVWRRPGDQTAPYQLVHLTIPVRHRRSGPLHLTAHVSAAESLEAAGRRSALLSRLIDQHSIAELPSQAGEAPTRQRGDRPRWSILAPVGAGG